MTNAIPAEALPGEPIIPLVLCGGSGTRLWPASRASRPKQFLPLLGTRSTFQETLLRVATDGVFARPVIIANREHRFLIADQLAELGVEADVLLEPEGRDSGPAIAAGASFIRQRYGKDCLVLALAADHFVRDIDGFRAACRSARAAARLGAIVTFGVVPDHPATGFGYIAPGEEMSGGARVVARFVEKPSFEVASRYVSEGYLWNSGNFLFSAETLIAEYAANDPETVAAATQAVVDATTDLGFLHLDAAPYGRTRRRSIDYAVVELTARAAVVPATFDWSDVGSWDSVGMLFPKDEAENAVRGNAVLLNARNNVVSSEGPTVAVVGVDDLAVVATADAVLVARRSDTAGIKALVGRLQEGKSSLATDHPQSFRPWGHYRSLDMGQRHQVKRILVKPKGRLSLQKHHHRSEHWVVVRGTALVTVGELVKVLHENESIYIPIGALHRLENPGKIDLEIIEVQTGSYLGEDDIVRVEDIYHREAAE